jgi:4-hydroxybutyrate CoA-transferase
MRIVTATEALSHVESGHVVWIHAAAAAPQVLVAALAERAASLTGIEIVQLHTEGPAPYAAPGMCGHAHTNSLFVGRNLRDAVARGEADYVPIFLSEVPALLRTGVYPLDVALVHCSPPDVHGFCSLGVSVEATRAAVKAARIVIAELNPRMPRTHGDALVHVDEIDLAVPVQYEIPEHAPEVLGETERAIGRHVAALVEDGATLQLGIGAIPDAALAALAGHRDLGIHTEMFSDGVVELVERGVITNARKCTHPGKLVAAFVLGTRRLYDFVDDNPQVAMLSAEYVNDTAVIRRNPRVTAINSAIEIDLTGQVSADSIGTRQYSGVGGQMDFMRGAALAPEGRAIIALPSRAAGGTVSRIVPVLAEGAGVVTSRAHVRTVITEYGVAELFGRSIRERAAALIAIAHPDFRDELARQAHLRFRV